MNSGKNNSFSDDAGFEPTRKNPTDLDQSERVKPARAENKSKPECAYQAGDQIGRYEMVRILGTGGFGHVLEARDPKLRRKVAIKLPRPDRIEGSREAFIEEARSLARLKHSSIVQVHNVEETSDGIPFVVMEYVEGQTIRELLQAQGMTYAKAIKYLIQLAHALVYAHSETVVHRDLKPGNVIVDNETDVAKLMDFGMALHDLTPDELLSDNPQGTPAYMAPEQIRGENHRIDCRTDIWAFGVMLYIILTSEKPFSGSRIQDLARNVCRRTPIAPREHNSNAPIGLERISLKCLQKRMKDRYQTASELAADLEAFLSAWLVEHGDTRSSEIITQDVEFNSSFEVRPQPQSRSHSAVTISQGAEGAQSSFSIVPKGLRSFDDQDAAFFLEMLAGPRDRNGVPDSVRFWTNCLQPGAANPVPVGLIYGPSGCGKSSFVKAGLLPQLSEEVKTIYIEASPNKTEQRILKKIEPMYATAIAKGVDLPTVFNRIRRGQVLTGEKLIIVIDQFEQWLHNRSNYATEPLTNALRQCDGHNLAVVLLVRDDFWMSISRFMAELDVAIQDGVNALGIPLFDRRHARKVLTGFGRALGALPDSGAKMNASQVRFVKESVQQMENNGEIIPIHIAMFAHMLDSDSWGISQLKKMGGWQGIGTQFLAKVFQDKRFANSQDSCRLLLHSLLPDSATPIKGAQKSVSQLMEAADVSTPARIQPILDLLDRDFKVITVTDSENNEPHYQLAHDSLVPPVRSWLTQKDQETWQGRARLRLESLSKQWNANEQEKRFLPSLFEFVPMQFGVSKNVRKPEERNFLKASSKYFLFRSLIALGLIAGIGLSIKHFFDKSSLQLAEDRMEQLATAHPLETSARLQLLEQSNPRDVVTILNRHEGKDWTKPKDLHFLLARSKLSDPSAFPLSDLLDSLGTAANNEFPNILEQLNRGRIELELDDVVRQVVSRFASAETKERKFRYASAALHLGKLNPLNEFLKFSPDPEAREFFIDNFSLCHGEHDDIVSVLRTSSDPAVLSALLKSVGIFERSDFPDNFERRLETETVRIFREANHPAVHSASEWLGKRLGFKLPALAAAADRSWVNHSLEEGVSETFVKIPKHSFKSGAGLPEAEYNYFNPDVKTIDLEKPFYASTKEVSRSLFRKFVLAQPPEGTIQKRYAEKLANSEEQDVPIANVVWFDAVYFCNWLSKNHQRKEVYRLNQAQDDFEVDPLANGFRLPTINEWECLNRAGTDSRYFFGENLNRVSRYAWTIRSTVPMSELGVGTRGYWMPNEFGVYDSVGNVFEFCQDPFSSQKIKADKSMVFYRGGSAKAQDRYFQSASFAYDYKSVVNTEAFLTGFRLVYNAE